jgi:hypothetical protein
VQVTPFAVTLEPASMSHTPRKTESAGDTITLSSKGAAIGRLPGFTSRAKNWLKVSQPLGATK